MTGPTAQHAPPQSGAALEHNLRWLSAWWILRWSCLVIY
jgi:hypothetical protein